MIKKKRGLCQKCETAFIFPANDIGRHVDPDNGLLMCWSCCKKRFWYDKDRCGPCSQKTMCKGLFMHNFRNHLNKGRIEGV